MKKIFTLIAAMFAAVAVNAQEGTTVEIDFGALDHAMSWQASETEEASTAGDILTAETVAKDGVSVIISPAEEGNKNPNRFWRANGVPQLRCYSGTITVKAEQDITGIEFKVNASKFNLTPNVGEVANNQWTGTAKEIVFTVGGNTQLNGLTVYLGGAPTPIVIEEINVAKALEIIGGLADGAKTDKEYKVTGYIVGDPEFQRNAETQQLYGNVNLYLADTKDGVETLYVFRAKDFGNKNFTEETMNSIKAGDQVTFQGLLQKYVKENQSTPELVSGYLAATATGIENVTAKAQNGKMFNLAGQEVSKNFKGIVIINGKKYMVK